jgi:UDPglucose 6-dehydrogenase
MSGDKPRQGPDGTIGVVGAGYVGLVTAAALTLLGHRVVCADINEAKVRALQAGQVPFFEPGLAQLLAEHRGRITFTTAPARVFDKARIVFVTVDTPPLPSGDADLSRVESVIDAIPLGVGSLMMVMKSTVPVGTGARVQRTLAQRGLSRVRYVANPEFLREGSALRDVTHPDRVVVGCDDPADAAVVAALWAPFGGESMTCDLASAEMIKLASNAFLATKISFVNEIANVCERVGADVEVVARGMGHDHRIGSAFLQAGIGYGGSCFPKDVSALMQLAGNSGYDFQLLSAVIEVNELQKRRVVTTLRGELGDLRGRRIALLGLAFKPGTDDMREATSVVLADRLVAEGARLVVHDPVVAPTAMGLLPPGVEWARDVAGAITGADAAVIVTEWPEYRTLLAPGTSDLMARPLLIDGRNLLTRAEAEDAGYEWLGVGKPALEPGESGEPALGRAG